MDMTYFAPRVLHPALCWMGKQEWLKFRPGENLRTEQRVELNKECPKEFLLTVQFILDSYKTGKTIGLTYFWAVSRTIANGPKCFKPTLDQCQSMQHTEANIPIKYYQQPYPQMIVEFPTEYIKELAEEFSFPVAQIPRAILQCFEQNTFVTVAVFNDATRSEYICMVSDRPEFATIDDAIARNSDIEQEFVNTEYPIARILQRMAANFGCLMTYTGITDLTPTADKLKLSKRKDERSQLLAMGEPFYFGLKQEIEMRKVVRRSGSDGEGKSPHPHWRGGHWRHTHYGRGKENVRLKFIRPVFVLAHLFKGDLADTSVTYYKKKKL